MKNSILKSAFALMLFTIFMACSSDSDDPVNVDPCLGISCQNGGTCNDGTCACPEGYSGIYCGTRVTPSKISITKVVIHTFPMQDGFGLTWDLGSIPESYPDVFFKIYRENTLVFQAPQYLIDSPSGGNYTANISPPVEITQVSTNHTFELYDYDNFVEDSDFMSGFLFKPFNTNVGGFPSYITYNEPDSGTQVSIYLSYEW